MKPPGVNFYSPVGIVSGLGSAGRGYLAALQAAAIPLCLIPVHELFVHQRSTGTNTRRQRPRHPIAIVHVNADAMPRFLHFHGAGFARARYRIGIWVWEMPALRDEWRSELQHFDEIWVPSIFCQRAVQAVTAKPVVVVPHVVTANDAPHPRYREQLRIAADEFVFLYIFDASSLVERKNPACLMDAFEAEFSRHDGVRLILKVSNLDPGTEFARDLDQFVARNPGCIALDRTMSPAELAGLVRTANCYVSPHRTEGFGLTVAEAMASGLPVIATDYGGTVDFVTNEVGYPLRHCLTEVDRDHGPYVKGAIWSDPSREHLRQLLRAVVASPHAAAAKGQLGRSRILRDYSATAIGRIMVERLAAIASA